MASTSALLSGLSGLSTNSRRLEVIGNNISNAGTTAFKSNRLMFSAAFNRTFSLGTTPSGTSGGTNPGQIGLGSALSGTQRNNSNGALNQTGVATDLAIEGEGFFILESQGERRYTRDGAFQLNSLNELVSVAGARVQGYAIDDNFQIVEGDVVGLTIPIGSLSVAEATTRVVMSGNLNVQELLQGAETPQGSQTTFGPLETAAATPALTTSLLTALIAPNTLVAGDTITLSGVERGNKGVPDATFTVTATSTVQNLFDFFQNALGIVDQGGLVGTDVNVGNNDGGIAIDPATGVVTVTGNVGTFSDLDFSSATVTTTGGGAFSPTFTSTREATGASVRTTVTVYDSVGTAIPVDITVAAYGEDGNGHYARVFFHADRDTDLGLDLEQGIRGAVGAYGPQLRFDNNGELDPAFSEFGVELDLLNTGAVDPLTFTVDFSEAGDSLTAFADGPDDSTLRATSVDGLAFGVLEEFSVGQDGIVSGFFTNGQVRSIGQVLLATFTNDEGLVDVGGNVYREGPNSGTAQITQATSQGAGAIAGGHLEQSNVDLSREFIDMILTSTGYNASSRVISTSDQLLQTLISLAR